VQLIRVGRRRINLEYLIMDEQHDGTPETAHIPAGGVRVTLESGIAFDLVGEEADSYNRAVDEALWVSPPKPTRSPSVGHSVPTGHEHGDRPVVPEKRKGRG